MFDLRSGWRGSESIDRIPVTASNRPLRLGLPSRDASSYRSAIGSVNWRLSRNFFAGASPDANAREICAAHAQRQMGISDGGRPLRAQIFFSDFVDFAGFAGAVLAFTRQQFENQ